MKFLIVLLGVLFVSSANADDAAVAERVTCVNIQASINELSAIEEPDENTIDELTKLKADYRRSCQRNARGRKSSASARVIVEVEKKSDEKQTVAEEPEAEEDVVEQEEVQSKKEEKKSESVKKEAVPETVVEENLSEEVVDESGKVEEEVAESDDATEGGAEKLEEVEGEAVSSEEDEVDAIKKNLEAGLCADGAQPNKYGCCSDELFKDMGNATFACCPKSGGDCFPPIK